MSDLAPNQKFESKRKRTRREKRQNRPPQPPPGPRFPDRWTHYLPIGKVINHSEFIAFKTPLSDIFFQGKSSVPFGPKYVVDHVSSLGKTLGLVIDLTATTRYYDSKEWSNYNVQYEKIICQGHTIHKQEAAVEQFNNVVKKFVKNNSDLVIGVHCTHGLNRTGYLICRYMIDHHGINPSTAIADFEVARGHRMERDAYVTSLRQRISNTSTSNNSTHRPELERMASCDSSRSVSYKSDYCHDRHYDNRDRHYDNRDRHHDSRDRHHDYNRDRHNDYNRDRHHHYNRDRRYHSQSEYSSSRDPWPTVLPKISFESEYAIPTKHPRIFFPSE